MSDCTEKAHLVCDGKRLSGEGQELPELCALGCAGPGALLVQVGLGKVSPALALAGSGTHAWHEERTGKTGVPHHLWKLL